MTDDSSIRIIDPEVEDRNEKFSVAMMGAASGQTFGLVSFFIGLVNGLMSDQEGGLTNVGIGLALFSAFGLLHLGISRRWVGAPEHSLQDSLPFLGPAFLGGLLYFYATFADMDWPFLGYVGGFLYLLLLGKGILHLEKTPPRSRKTTYVFSPFEKQALLIVVLIGSILGVGVGMSAQGHRAVGRGPFSRTFLSEKITSARFQADLLLFGIPHSYRLIQALSQAERKGIRLRLLVTRETLSRYAGEISTLTTAHIPIRILPTNLPSYVRPMALFDRRILLHGSGGWGSLNPDGGDQMRFVANLLSIGKIRTSQRTFDSLWRQSRPLNPFHP